MCKVVEDLCNDAKLEEKKEIAVRLLSQCVLSNEQIAECVGLSVEMVEALAKEENLQTVLRNNLTKGFKGQEILSEDKVTCLFE